MQPTITVIIPARLGSMRFPRKVLADETGKPLIRHVWERATAAKSAPRAVVATDSEEVAGIVRGFGAEAVLTSPDHPNGTSRLEEAARLLGLRENDIVVNVQGDEPELDPGAIDAAVAVLVEKDAPVSTIASPFGPGEDPSDPNIVKAIVARDGRALYFTRALAPYPRQGGTPVAPLRHIGLYVYRVAVLRRYVQLPATPLEQCEMLEQLRLLEHGYTIAVAVHPCRAGGVDTPEQYREFVKRYRAAHQ